MVVSLEHKVHASSNGPGLDGQVGELSNNNKPSNNSWANGKIKTLNNDKEKEKENQRIDSSNKKSLFINSVMVVKILKDYYIVLKPENENKTSYLNSFEITQIVPQVFKMLDRNLITGNNLLNLLVEGDGKSFVFSFKLAEKSLHVFRNFELEAHLMAINLSNSSTEIGECWPFSIPLSFSTYSSLNSSSSTGYHPSSSQNSWSSLDKVPVLRNLLNTSCLSNLITALARNSESNLTFSDFSNMSFIETYSGIDYKKLSVEDFKLMPEIGLIRMSMLGITGRQM